MTSLESLLNVEDLAYQPVPELSVYLASPTTENARQLLLAFDLYIPYSRANAARAARAGRAGVTSRRGGANQFSKKDFDLHAVVDFIHDIHQNSRIPDIVLSRLIGKTPTPAELVPLCKKFEPITAQLAEMLQRRFQIASKAIPMDTPTTKLSADRAFQAIVANWMRTEHLQIILDGILAPLSADAGAANEPKTARTLLFCAFLQLLLTGYKPIEQTTIVVTTRSKRPRESPPASEIQVDIGVVAPKTITFLTGTFQYLDVGGWDTFFSKWKRSLSRESAYLALVQKIDLKRISIASLRPFGDNVAAVSNDAMTLRSSATRIPYQRPQPPKTVAPRPNESSDAAYLREEAANIHVTYTKDRLARSMVLYATLNRTERGDPDIDAFIDRLIAVNAFRDRYKADVAIQKDAVFVTMDRLALVYYTMRTHEQNRPNRGLFLYPEGLRAMTVATDRI